MSRRWLWNWWTNLSGSLSLRSRRKKRRYRNLMGFARINERRTDPWIWQREDAFSHIDGWATVRYGRVRAELTSYHHLPQQQYDCQWLESLSLSHSWGPNSSKYSEVLTCSTSRLPRRGLPILCLLRTWKGESDQCQDKISSNPCTCRD